MSKMKSGVLILLIIGLVSLAIMSTTFLFNGVRAEEPLVDSEVVYTVDSENTNLNDTMTEENSNNTITPNNENPANLIPPENIATFSNSGIIQGYALTNTGPIKGVLIELYDYNMGMFIKTALTDQNGFFKFENLPPSEYSIDASKEDYTLYQNPGSFQLTDGEIKNMSFGFQSHLSTVYGQTTDVSGNILPYVSITIYDALGNILMTSVSDSNGQYAIENVPSKATKIQGSFPGYSGFSWSLFESINQWVYSRVIMWPAHNLSGGVFDTNGNPICGATVTLNAKDEAFDNNYTTTTDASGAFYFENILRVIPFQIQVTVSAPGYNDVTTKVQIFDSLGLHVLDSIVLTKVGETNAALGNLETTTIKTTTAKTLPQTGNTSLILAGILAFTSGFSLIKLNKKH